MTIQRDPRGRSHFISPFMGESMMDKSLLASTDTGPVHLAADPKKDSAAQFIPKIEVNQLLAPDLNDLAVERTMLENLQTARSVREVALSMDWCAVTSCAH